MKNNPDLAVLDMILQCIDELQGSLDLRKQVVPDKTLSAQEIGKIVNEHSKEVTINFKPKPGIISQIDILGQFNSWLPDQMEPYSEEEIAKDLSLKGFYYYKVRLLIGYKYRYHFCVNEDEDF